MLPTVEPFSAARDTNPQHDQERVINEEMLRLLLGEIRVLDLTLAERCKYQPTHVRVGFT